MVKSLFYRAAKNLGLDVNWRDSVDEIKSIVREELERRGVQPTYSNIELWARGPHRIEEMEVCNESTCTRAQYAIFDRGNRELLRSRKFIKGTDWEVRSSLAGRSEFVKRENDEEYTIFTDEPIEADPARLALGLEMVKDEVKDIVNCLGDEFDRGAFAESWTEDPTRPDDTTYTRSIRASTRKDVLREVKPSRSFEDQLACICDKTDLLKKFYAFNLEGRTLRLRKIGESITDAMRRIKRKRY